MQPVSVCWRLTAKVAGAISMGTLVLGSASHAAVATYSFKDVRYSYTISCANYTGSTTPCETALTGGLTGSFEYDDATGLISVVGSSIIGDSAPYVKNNAQDASSVGIAHYIGGRVLAPSGTTQTLVLWGMQEPGATCGPSQDMQTKTCDYGISLTFAGSLDNQLNKQIMSFVSTGNDNFCNRVNSLSTTNYCTSQKNNITQIHGTAETPSPAIALGLAPVAGLAARRKSRHKKQPLWREQTSLAD